MPKALKIILILCVVAGVIGLGLVGYGFWNSFFRNGSLPMTLITLSEKTNYYSIEGEYPQFPTAPSQFNKEISDYISAQINDFKKTVAENEPQDTPATPFDFTLTWTHGQISRDSISFVIHIGAYEGGANDAEYIKSFDYDLIKKKDLGLRDFFSQPDYLSRLSAVSRAQLADHLRATLQSEPDMNMIKAGTAPDESNFSNFTVDGNYMTIYFPKYQVAPGSAGEQTITIEISKL